jgi:pyruvate dehydrogenase (quinone)
MSKTAADFMLERLQEWRIDRIYGYPGDGINGILGALGRHTDEIEFVQARHEEMAAFMACGHAKWTGQPGVCLATSGPGAIHLLNGLYDAKLDHQPVVAIVGQQDSMAIGGNYQQEVDLQTLFKDVASEYIVFVSTPEQMRHAVDRAVRIAKAERTVTCIIVPNDVQSEKAVEQPPHVHGTIHSGVGYSEPRVIPQDAEIAKAAEILNSGKKVAMLIGQGAIGAADEVKETAERLGAGVAKALLGKAALPDDLPYVTGSIGIRYPMESLLVGDARSTLQALIPHLERKEDRSWREEIEGGVERWWKIVEERAMQDADPINPQRVFWELSSRLPDYSILSSDSGSAANWFARDLRLREGMMASLSGTLATMGPGVPYAIAAKFAHPDRPAIALVGDGAMQMNGNAELVTIAKYWKEWSDPRLVVMVLNNHDLNQVTWEQRVLEGDPKLEASQNVPEFDYAQYAEQIGLRGIRMETPDDVGPGWDEALTSDRPVVIDAVVDPTVPPLPPHIKVDQAKAFASAIFKGDSESWDVIKQSIKGKAAELTAR